MPQESERNAELFRAVADVIERHPERYDKLVDLLGN